MTMLFEPWLFLCCQSRIFRVKYIGTILIAVLVVSDLYHLATTTWLWKLLTTCCPSTNSGVFCARTAGRSNGQTDIETDRRTEKQTPRKTEWGWETEKRRVLLFSSELPNVSRTFHADVVFIIDIYPRCHPCWLFTAASPPGCQSVYRYISSPRSCHSQRQLIPGEHDQWDRGTEKKFVKWNMKGQVSHLFYLKLRGFLWRAEVFLLWYHVWYRSMCTQYKPLLQILHYLATRSFNGSCLKKKWH